MKKIFPLIVASIFVLSGLGAVAIPEEQTTPEPLLQPVLEIGTINGGFFKLTVPVENNGFADATDVQYNMHFEGGLIIFPPGDSGKLGTIVPGGSTTVTFKPIGIGLGILAPISKITFYAECAEGSSAQKTADFKIILVLTIIQ
jgi:hypothetical protein